MIHNKKIVKIMVVFAIFAGTAACGGTNNGIDKPVHTIDPIAEIMAATLEAAEKEESENALSAQGTQEEDGTGPAWLANDEIPTGLILPDYLAGLVYRSDGVWLVDHLGTSRLVFGQPFDGELSPDGRGYLYSSSMNEGEDIYYLDKSTGEVSQFTHSPNIFERGYRWWPGRSDVIVFNFIPEAELGPWSGYLGAYDIARGETIILEDEKGSSSSFSLSPDGRNIAFNNGQQPMIYTWGQSMRAIDMAGMGLDHKNYTALAWSPDGKQIAFLASGGVEEGGGSKSANLIYSIESNRVDILHEFISYGRRAEPEISWNPNGDWLAVVNPGEIDAGGDPIAMWVMRFDGTEKYHLGFSSHINWSPGGEHLIYIEWPSIGAVGDQRSMVVESGSWEPSEIIELQGSFIDQWIELR